MGLGPSASTVGQEQLISGNVGKQQASMQYRVVDATKKLARDLGFMLWHDQWKEIPGQIPIEGAEGYSLPANWTPEDREGDFFDYNFDIDVYSMPYQSPSEKANALSQLLTTIYIPAMQLLAQQGGQVNFKELTDIFANLFNMPRLKQIVQFTGMTPEMAAGGGGGPEEGAGPTSTNRTYTRKSVAGGGTQQGRMATMQQQWAGTSAPQNDAMLARPPG